MLLKQVFVKAIGPNSEGTFDAVEERGVSLGDEARECWRDAKTYPSLKRSSASKQLKNAWPPSCSSLRISFRAAQLNLNENDELICAV